jgi:hypothetical protein
LSSGAFWEYLSGSAAVEMEGEEIAPAHAEADPGGPRCESTESLNLGSNKLVKYGRHLIAEYYGVVFRLLIQEDYRG